MQIFFAGGTYCLHPGYNVGRQLSPKWETSVRIYQGRMAYSVYLVILKPVWLISQGLDK